MTTDVVESQLAVAVQDAGLSTTSAAELLAAFQPHFDEAKALVIEGSTLNVTDATQVTEIKAARALRLKLKAVRVESEKKRKALKEDSLRTGKAIDKVASVVDLLASGAETALLEMEQFAERKEAERKAALKKSREILLAPYGIDTQFLALGEMPDSAFSQMLESTIAGHEAKLAAARKAEEERVAAEKERAEEDARIRAENEKQRLALEAQERLMAQEREKAAAEAKAAEDKARAEREAHEAALRKEREAREALEAKAKAEKAAADRKAAAEAKAARQAELAPDKDKITAIANTLTDMPMPNVSASAKKALGQVQAILIDAAARIRALAGTLE